MNFIKNEVLSVKIKNLSIMLIGNLLMVLAINMFITPANLYTGGLTGIAQLIIEFLSAGLGIELSLGTLVFVFNIPILYLAWRSIGKRFAVLSMVAVVIQSVMLEMVPIGQFSEDILLNAVFGGVLVGAGIGMILKIGGSTGGMDIIFQYISMKYDGSFGKYSFSINAIIILIAGLTQSWETALYTIICIYITSVVVDRIHTIHQNLTLYIVTTKEEEMIETILKHLYRGITVLEGRGAYTKNNKSVLMLVLSSYELYEVLAIIKSVDEHSFTNVVRSEMIQGNFVKKKI
ncbi:MAG: YitT family protein [Turicibacter sanguinis]|uniref:YitT family protein n=1 Tax=Turicibacter TaxID=191303 RepID=UPI0001FDB353|nr:MULTISPECIES: YitT family protein [Turicibacter]EGC91760.1 putative membrane protein [Turicibacter sp. HGF1]MCU7196255.1 YitT family protein [Turicibacter sanguinis]